MNKLIHKGYFKEMFNQLKVTGIVGACILMLTNVTAIFNVIAERESLFEGYYGIPEGSTLASPMMIFIYIMGIALTFNAFGWMNKRATSDFYHAVPITRTQIYFSSILAAFCWMVIGLVSYAVVHALIYAVLGSPFNYVLYLCVLVNMLIASIEVIGAVSIGCAISGTRFVNLFASIIILFMPRFLFTVVAMFIHEVGSSSLVIPSIAMIFNPTYNIIASPYANLIAQSIPFFTVDFADVLAMIYTLVYSIALVILGWIAFKRRKSETAGIPTTNKLFQGVIRTAVGLPLLMILVYSMLDGSPGPTAIILLVLFAFVFYCLYELISTRSIKKMLKAMPLFLICILISGLMLVIPTLIAKTELNAKADTSNIKSYSVVSDDNRGIDILFGGYGELDDGYAAIRQEAIEFSDPESLKIIADAYARSVDERNDPYYYENASEYIRIERKGALPITRRLTFKASEYKKLKNLRDANGEYSSFESEFPEGKTYCFIYGLTRSQSEELGLLFREEFEKLSVEARKSLLVTDFSDSDMELCIYGCYGPKNYRSRYVIGDMTPKTARKYLEYINKNNGAEAKDAISKIVEWMESGGDDIYFYVDIDNGNAIVNNWDLRYFMMEDRTRLPMNTDPEYYEIFKMLDSASLTNDPSHFILIHVRDMNYNFSGYSDKLIAVELSQQQKDRISELIVQFYGDRPYDDYIDDKYGY